MFRDYWSLVISRTRYTGTHVCKAAAEEVRGHLDIGAAKISKLGKAIFFTFV